MADKSYQEMRHTESSRYDAAVKAHDYFEGEILSFEGSGEDAAHLASSYLMSVVEMRTHETDPEHPVHRDYPEDEFQFEFAITAATRGDFTYLKTELVKMAEVLGKSNEELGVAVSKIKGKIPDKGELFELPPYAWQDPRFGGNRI